MRSVRAIYESGNFPFHPLERGAPDYGDGDYQPGDDGAEMLPSDLDPEEMRKVDPAT